MDLLEQVRRKNAAQLRAELKSCLLKKMGRLGFDPNFVEGWRYDPKLLTLNEYRIWWVRSKIKLPDSITGEIEPHDEMRPYLYQNGKPKVYNTVVMWSGISNVLHPPVKALPEILED